MVLSNHHQIRTGPEQLHQSGVGEVRDRENNTAKGNSSCPSKSEENGATKIEAVRRCLYRDGCVDFVRESLANCAVIYRLYLQPIPESSG